MNASKLPALQTLVKIRLKRQDALDAAKLQAHTELKRLIEAVEAAATALNVGHERVSQQVAKLDTLTTAGARFQISEYLAEQDFLGTLSAEARDLEVKHGEAETAVTNQNIVLKEARVAAAHNETQRVQLTEKISSILAKIDIEQMDRQDEESEEANIVLTRRRQQSANELGGGADHV